MPRERIHHGEVLRIEQGPPPGVPVPEGEPVLGGVSYEEQPSLDVSWNREGEWVQVSISAPHVWWKKWLAGHEIEEEAFGVFTDRLTRQEINKMIATLRRARDGAYGKDE